MRVASQKPCDRIFVALTTWSFLKLSKCTRTGLVRQWLNRNGRVGSFNGQLDRARI
jgi:hypothetical protein